MPEFILDHGSAEGARTFAGLDCFTQGYIEALFFTNASGPDDGPLASATFADLASETLGKIIYDCQDFQGKHRDDLWAAMRSPSHDHTDDGYGLKAAGRDFWYTRNGHGVGFWDRGLGDVGEKLTKAAHAFGEVDVYSGDDNRIYLSGGKP